MEKYFNDAIIGNKNLKASFTEKGELIRLLYPSVDYRQFINYFHIGMKINDSNIIYLHNDINNSYNQYYIEDTNILKTEILNTYFELKIIQTDFVSTKQNLLIRKYKFINENNIDLNLDCIIHSSLLTNDNNQVSGYCINNNLIQYTHDYTFSTFSKMKVKSSQINNTMANIEEGQVYDKDYVGLSSDSSISYEIGILKPKEEKEIEVFIYVNEVNSNIDELENEIEKIKKTDVKLEFEDTKKYWKKYLKQHNTIDLSKIKNRKVEEIYKRTILLYPLLLNYETGGISAAIEIDEQMTQCGRYSFCWPRDAVFITKAMDILKMDKETEKFYKHFCKNTQAKNGMWEQRFYTDGKLAPAWGYQIDETASVIYGIYDHYTRNKDKKFLKDNLKMCEKAIHYLKSYIEDILNNENKLKVSYDLWEMYEGTHLYSIASIFAAFDAMMKIYNELSEEIMKNRLKQENVLKEKDYLQKKLIEIKKFIESKLYDNSKKSFVRNLEDKKIDISILGIINPFNIFTAKEKKVQNTVEKINLTLRTYTGGYQRFENDHYMKGNPWVIATLWMANYYIEAKDYKKAKECFNFVTKTSSKLGFLGEQIDNEKCGPAWVIGLGWSHAMYIITLNRLVNGQ